MRREVTQAKRIVVKIGSSSLTLPDGRLDLGRLSALSADLAAIHARGVRVVLVTSGAIAAALGPLGLRRRPKDLETQQAAAAVGQGLLVRHYSDAFAAHGATIAQLLLTVDDVLSPTTYRNALNTFSRLFRLGVIPIVNENDTVATHEIRFGDNDRLAALIAHLVRADVLLLLSDVKGLYTAHPDVPGAELIRHVRDVHSLQVDTSRLGSRVGTGGMRTKLQAAEIATSAGVSVVLAHADDLSRALSGDEVGTLFEPSGKRRPRRLLWLAHAAEPRGRVHVDGGAVEAIVQRQASLLPVGVVQVEGAFSEGEPIEVAGPDGRVVARGFAGYGSHELVEAVRNNHGEDVLGMHGPVVHRDLLVLL
ncbi:glutamate 5-kinase [Tessaracoccus sp. OH4464_COT-324]|uniref:glutamate 5-kinase n=1 Tax=Tessaracoccus sp. OH4464_COT-324 TaxID=2491059 RepID=UPI000F6426E8|nr:glutamate 5-kinase [Tessaracoccus sp. OH4464_COT-324]RRD47768.1 glutamate 5-kinase [Tessaracoccus sp. OH4464_COT-324]